MTAARVEFRTPQATGWAVGVKYAGKTNTLTLVVADSRGAEWPERSRDRR